MKKDSIEFSLSYHLENMLKNRTKIVATTVTALGVTAVLLIYTYLSMVRLLASGSIYANDFVERALVRGDSLIFFRALPGSNSEAEGRITQDGLKEALKEIGLVGGRLLSFSLNVGEVDIELSYRPPFAFKPMAVTAKLEFEKLKSTDLVLLMAREDDEWKVFSFQLTSDGRKMLRYYIPMFPERASWLLPFKVSSQVLGSAEKDFRSARDSLKKAGEGAF